MYSCPNCGGHIRYDIPTAMIHCDNCDSSFDPYALDGGQDAEEQKTYETTLFTCPHCGGEITSTDVTAASFCTYCGSPVILSSRVSREKRPAMILPFTRTKEDCKEAYRKLMNRAVFVPKELRDPAYLEQFRGIYIPYWLYDVQFHGVSSINGSKEHRECSYIVKTDYELRGDLDAVYPNIYYDASSSFDDSIGETIAPYESGKLQPFAPSFLCGFYADTSDVPGSVYQSDAKKLAEKEVSLALSKHPSYRNFSPDADQNIHLNPEMAEARLTMFPVWFLTWRKGDRVAYAVANGQTGKISADLPIDYGKYILGSLLVSLPIFLLLNLLFTLTPAGTLLITSGLAVISLLAYSRQLGIITERKERVKDKGYQYMQEKMREPADDSLNPLTWFSGKKKSSPTSISLWCAILAALFFNSVSGSRIIIMILLVMLSLLGFFAAGKIRTAGSAVELLTPAGAVLAPVLALVILIIHPVDDIYYYAGALLSLAGIGLNIIGILRKYNDQAMRPLPDFVHREGGDNRA